MSLVVLISGNGSNLQAIIDANIPISAVISNQANAFGVKRAQQAHIPTHIISNRDFPSREAFDQALLTQIELYQPKLVVLAGFMRILGEQFIMHFMGRLINIHPSLLPKHKGLHTHRHVLEAGDTEHGVSVHYVNANLDGGPIISQSKLTVEATDNEVSLQQRVQTLEHRLYPHTIKLILNGRVRLTQDRVVFDGSPLAKSGIMLNL